MKKRLDVLLFEKGLYLSREKAKQAIELGRVKVDGVVQKKPSFLADENSIFETLPFEFVSRGGFKLQKALEDFGVSVTNKTVLDIGASTGGFTDVCLQNGAKKVYAVDTGIGQLVEKIKCDTRVVNLEKTNYLTLDKSQISDVNFVVIDVSFVSLTKLSQKLFSDFEHVEIVALIKPQFECGVDYARKHKGIVKDQKMHEKIVEKIRNNFCELGFVCLGVVESSIKGGDGNTEFLIYLKK
ncbi:MAG: TlyA family RNA methyltransferase [Clostridia bacterium]|nr:TlyA family RNA methyltransferase [Clostridia bacterium]